MACSRYEYVKKFEQVRPALLQTYIIVRIDGRSFTKFCSEHQFEKPNDLRALKLMNAAAQFVCNNFQDIFLAYGQSDQYSFAFKKCTTLFSRRIDKILSCVVSAFTSAFVFNWGKMFKEQLREIPMFDSRIIIYPNDQTLKDYFRWRQVDCHINNLYNTTFWCMVKKGKGNREVEEILKDTNSSQKNQILFSDFNINYNKIDQIYRRGTFFMYSESQPEEQNSTQVEEKQEKEKQENEKKEEQIKEDKLTKEKEKKKKKKKKLVQSHEDCIKEIFWTTLL